MLSNVRAQSSDDVELARRATNGDGEAFGQLFERWFDRAFDVAWHVVRNRDSAAETTQDAFASAWQQITTLRQPESFGGWLLRITRNKALNRLDRDRHSRPFGDDEELAVLDGEHRTGDDPAALITSRQRDDLVWAASAALGEADASLLSLHLRHGLDPGELADELGVAPNTAHQRLFRLRKRLGDAIAAWTVWQHGSPHCETLRELLAAAGLTRFDRAASSLISDHVDNCPDCRSRRTLALSPEALFAASPLMLADPQLKTEAAAALSAAGVPVRPPHDPAPGPPHPSPQGGRRVARLATASVAALALVAVLAMLATQRDQEPLAAGPTQSTGTADEPIDSSHTTEPRSATTAPPATTSDTSPIPPAPSGVPADPDPPVGASGPSTTVTPTTTSTASTAAPTPAPIISGFQVRPASAPPCSGQTVRVTFEWETTHATSALLGPTGGPAQPVDPNSSTSTCAVAGSRWSLQVTGPGGTTTDQVTVP